MVLKGSIVSAAVWPDAISELIPEVDILFIGREKLAPKRFFRATEKDQCLLPFEEVRAVLKPYHTSEYPIGAFRLPSPVTPVELHKFVRLLKPSTEKLRRVPMDEVFNSEIVSRVR